MYSLFLLLSLVGTSVFAAPLHSDAVAAGDVTAILSHLAEIDANRASASDVKVNFQNMASHSHFDHDNAKYPLFTTVSDDLLAKPTYTALEKLAAEYTLRDATVADPNSASRSAAIDSFLDAINSTDVFQAAWQFLQKQRLATADYSEFKKLLGNLWFNVYARKSAAGSSGFETVFVGETLDGDVVGLTNWLRFFHDEKAGNINYHGWFARDIGVQVSLQFAWDDAHALQSSILLNSSPEFEFSAYTICALSGQTECTLAISGSSVNLNVETANAGGVNVISEAYPSIGSAPPKPTKNPVTGKPVTGGPKPNQGELQDLVTAMRSADADRALDSQYTLNWGSKAGKTGQNPLFTTVDETVFNRPVYHVLQVIYDQKILTPDVCVAEPAYNTGFRKTLFNNVLNTFTNTSIFAMGHQYLVKLGKADSDVNVFKDFLFTLWFGTYSRCGSTLGSSGFEHVFSGEWRNGEVDGQHNWMKYYGLEKAGDITYEGYYSYDKQLTGTFEYKWEKEIKKKGGFLIGTSPAFDFTLFTVCSLSHSGSHGCKFDIDGFPISVTSYTQKCQGSGTCLSTSYPSDS